MKSMKIINAVMVVAGMALVAGTARASLYDSGGFEAPQFVAETNLTGQDLLSGPWQQDGGTSTATVQTNNVQAGLQSVKMDRASGLLGDTRWWVNAPAAGSGIVDIGFDMSVNVTANLTSGPLFGVEAVDDSSGTRKLIGGVMLDAAQGTLLYDAGRNATPTSTGLYYSRNQYHHYDLAVDYDKSKYSVYVDGSLAVTQPFVDHSAAAFSAAPLVTLLSPDGGNDTGTAYFDNYAISQVSSLAAATTVPEPVAAGLLGLGALGMLMKRRRGA